MPTFYRFCFALLIVAVLVPTAWAQNDRRQDDEDEDAIVIRRNGNVVFRDRDGNVQRFEFDDHHPFLSDTLIDGARVFRFRSPDGDEQTFEFRMPSPEHFRFDGEALERDLARLRSRVHEFEFDEDGPHVFFRHDGDVPFGGALAEGFAGLAEHFTALGGASEETRRAMRELERRSRELARELRRAEGRDRDRLTEELDDTLSRLFDVRGAAREEAAARLDEQAERFRQQADELRESLRDRQQRRRELIEERKRDLTGERGSDW